MKQLLHFILLTTIALCISCGDDENQDFLNDWDEDIFFFSKNLKEKHIDLFFNISETEFDQDIAALRSSSPNLTEAEAIIGLTKIISKIGDSHTVMSLGSKLTFLPYRLQWLDDGMFLTEVGVDQEDLLGKQIVRINKVPMAFVLDSFRTVIPYENEPNFKNQVVAYLRGLEFFNYFGFGTSTSEITLNLEGGVDVAIGTATTETASISHADPPLFLENTEEIYWSKELTADDILYIQYNACREREDLSFQSFTDHIIDNLNSNPSIEKIVFDLRHNGGGNSTIARPFIDELERLVEENRIDNANVYVVIGRRTFSSAILNALEIEQKINPTFIGESTGGKPNHYGEVRSFELPNSRLKVYYSTKYFQFSSHDEDSLEPDIFIEYNSEHLFNGIDPVLDFIKN